jgi:hypothetical protein
MIQLLLFNITNGLIIGAFYVLMALGLSLILNLTNVVNFVHGGFLLLGGYFAYMLTPYLGFWGVRLVAPLLSATIGLTLERACQSGRCMGAIRKRGHHAQLADLDRDRGRPSLHQPGRLSRDALARFGGMGLCGRRELRIREPYNTRKFAFALIYEPKGGRDGLSEADIYCPRHRKSTRC